MRHVRKQVACGMFHTMFLMQSSEVHAICRRNRLNPVLHTNYHTLLTPIEPLPLTPHRPSQVFALGRGDWGLLGMGDRMDRKVPCKITELQVRRPSAPRPQHPEQPCFC
jgi:hypothetical protein